MSKAAQMTFKRGDGLTKYFYIPTASWSAGGELRFGAKSQPDNDVTDAQAVINKVFSDSAIMASNDPNYVAGYVGYRLTFLPTDIVGVSFTGGVSKLKFLGEFQYTPTTGVPVSFPSDDSYIQVTIFADILREAP